MEAARRPSAAASAAVTGILGRGHDSSSTPARHPLSARRARSAELDTMWVARWAEAGGQEPVTDSDTDPDPEALPDAGKAALLAPNAAPGRNRIMEPPADTARRWADLAPSVGAPSPMGLSSTRAAGDELSLRRMDNPHCHPLTVAHLQRASNPGASMGPPAGPPGAGGVCPQRGPLPPPAVLERRLETLQTRLQMLRQRLKEERQALALAAAAKARAAAEAGSGAAPTPPPAGRTGMWGQRPVLAVPRPGLLAPPPSPLTPSPEFPREQPPPPPPSSTAAFDPRACSAFSSEHFRGCGGISIGGSSSFGGRVRIGGRLPPSSSAPFSRSLFAPSTYPPSSSDAVPRAPPRRLYDRFSSWNDPEPFNTRYVSPCSSNRIFGVTHTDYAGVGGEATADADPFQAALRDAAQLCAQEADRLRAAQRELSLLSSGTPAGGKGAGGGGGGGPGGGGGGPGGGPGGGGGYPPVRAGLPPAHWLRRRVMMQPNNVSGSLSFAGGASPASTMPPHPIHRGGPSSPSSMPPSHTPMAEAAPLRLF